MSMHPASATPLDPASRAAALRENWNEDKRWEPDWEPEKRDAAYEKWQKAVSKTLDWVDVE